MSKKIVVITGVLEEGQQLCHDGGVHPRQVEAKAILLPDLMPR